MLNFPTVIRSLAQSILLLLATFQAAAQPVPRPDVPDKIKAPLGEEVVLEVHASGSQIYTCQQGTDGKFAWTLKGPDAELRDEKGAIIGHHFAGPTWKLNDGSQVVGKATARVDAPEADSIPWLLLAATDHSGSGALSRVTSIQRIHTHGGQPPAATECGPGKQNAETRSTYSADYYFYAPSR